MVRPALHPMPLAAAHPLRVLLSLISPFHTSKPVVGAQLTEVKDAQYISFFPKNEKTSSISYTGYIRYIETFRNADGTVIDAPVGEDFKITCNQNFKDIELNEKYSINFYGGFRHLSTDFLDQIAHLVVGIAFILK